MQKKFQAAQKMGLGRNFWKIDKRLLPVKVHYFLFMAALSCVLPFRTVFVKQLGISATAIGIIFLAIPVIKIVTNPLFGFLVDYFKRFRLTLVLLMTVVAITHVAMVFIPPLSNAGENTNDLETFVKYDCSEGNVSYFRVLSTHESPNDIDITCAIKCEGVFSSQEDACAGHFVLESKVLLSGSGCNMKYSLTIPSFVVFQNSSPTTVVVEGNRFSFSSIGAGAYKDKNCSSHALKELEHHTHRSRNILSNNITSSINDTRNFQSIDRFLKEYKLFMFSTTLTKVDSFADINPVCPCNEWLHCVRMNCTDGNFIVSEKPEDMFLSYQFWMLFALFLLSNASFAAVCFLVDTVSYEMIQDRRAKYGQQRLWGTVGWGLGALAGGYLNEIITVDSLDVDYSLSFYLLAALIVVDFIPVSQFKVEDVKYSSNICKDVFILLSNAKIFTNVLVVFWIGVLSGLIWNYQFWFMDEIGASQVLLGLSQTVECLLAEVPCFIISGWVIRKIGYANCNNLTLVCFGLRYLCFYYMRNPWLTLPVAIIHGPTFGIFYAALTMYAKTEAPPGTEATVQSVLAVAFEGIGCGLGSMLGGIGFDKFGSRVTFLLAAIVSFVLLAVNVLLQFTIWRRKVERVTKLDLPPAAATSDL